MSAGLIIDDFSQTAMLFYNIMLGAAKAAWSLRNAQSVQHRFPTKT